MYETKMNIEFGIIMIITIFSSIPIAFAEFDEGKPPITVEWKLTDAPEGTYFPPVDGTNITIFGVINAGYDSTFEINEKPEFQVSIKVTSPAEDMVFLDQVAPICVYDQCYFESTFRIGPTFEYTGQYKITAKFNNQMVTDYIPYIKSASSYESLEPQDESLTESNTELLSLQEENKELKQQVSSLQSQIIQLEKRVDDLNAIVHEQLKVIYEWVVAR